MTCAPDCPGGRYQRGGRCDKCRAVQAKRQATHRRRLAEKQYGLVHEFDRVSPDEARQALRDARQREPGLSFVEIARVTGVGRDGVRKIHNGQATYIARRTHERIMSAYGPDVHIRRKRSATQLEPWQQHEWKLQALFAQGWRKVDLKQLLEDDGRHSGWLEHLSGRTHRQVRNVQHIDWLVEQIGDRQGPSEENKRRMRTRGIFPLIHYTEDGKLIRGSLTPEQLAAWRRVRSNHGSSSSGGNGS